MLGKNHLIVLSIGIALVSNSCKKTEGPIGPVGPPGPSYTGVISGNVTLYDDFGDRLYSNVNGTTVLLKSGDSQQTDSNGHFLFSNVNTGNYIMRASRDGFGASAVANISFISDTFYQEIKMSQKPTWEVLEFTAYHNLNSPWDSLVAKFPAIGKTRTWLLCVNKAGTANSTGDYKLVYTKTIVPNTTSSVIRVPASDLNSAGIFYGDVVNYTAYSYAVNDVSVYKDPATGKSIYNAVGTGISDTTISP
jgi:hypothetical protein